MKRSRFTEEQIIGILREQEAGVTTAEVCRRHGVSSATFYKWKAKFGGLDVSEARRLKSLEDENARLKRMLADAMLELRRPPYCQPNQSLLKSISDSRYSWMRNGGHVTAAVIFLYRDIVVMRRWEKFLAAF